MTGVQTCALPILTGFSHRGVELGFGFGRHGHRRCTARSRVAGAEDPTTLAAGHDKGSDTGKLKKFDDLKKKEKTKDAKPPKKEKAEKKPDAMALNARRREGMEKRRAEKLKNERFGSGDELF